MRMASRIGQVPTGGAILTVGKNSVGRRMPNRAMIPYRRRIALCRPSGTRRTVHGPPSGRQEQPFASETGPLLQGGAARRLLPGRGAGRPEDPAHPRRARLRAGVHPPGGYWTNVPVQESFAAKSPYLLRHANDRFLLEHDALGHVAEIALSPRPDWYTRKTATGKPMTRIGSLQGTYLGVYPSKVCEYWLEKPKEQCRFCSVGLNLGADDADEKSVNEVVEVVEAARRESGITYVDFNTGHYQGDTYLDILEPYIKAVKEKTGLLIGVQTPPHHDLERYKDLRRMGVNRVSFCFELFNREKFVSVCPGKNREYGLDRYLEAVEYCATKVPPTGRGFEPWVTNGEIIAGLEPPRTRSARSTGSLRSARSRPCASSGRSPAPISRPPLRRRPRR